MARSLPGVAALRVIAAGRVAADVDAEVRIEEIRTVGRERDDREREPRPPARVDAEGGGVDLARQGIGAETAGAQDMHLENLARRRLPSTRRGNRREAVRRAGARTQEERRAVERRRQLSSNSLNLIKRRARNYFVQLAGGFYTSSQNSAVPSPKRTS